MKVARYVMKCVSLGLVIGSAVCAVIAYWDKLTDAFYNLADKIEEKRAARCSEAEEYDDYLDYDNWENC